MTLDEELRIFREIAISHLSTPYLWGGDDPMGGFDCSGYAIECLKSVGRLPLSGDWTASQLMDLFPATETPQLGVLCFRPNGRHVELCLNDVLSVGASGGTSVTTSIEAAMQQNAYHKVRPFRSRGLTVYRDPFKRGG